MSKEQQGNLFARVDEAIVGNNTREAPTGQITRRPWKPLMRALVFLLSEKWGHKGVKSFNFWFKRTSLAVVLGVNCRKAFNVECTFLFKAEQREVEKIALTSEFLI